MIALIDADSLLYKVAFAIEDKVLWNELEIAVGIETEEQLNYYTNIPQCFKTFDTLVSNILMATDCDEELLVFTGSNNFRYFFPISYKAHRQNVRKPLGINEVLEYAKEKYTFKIVEDIEADDYVVWLKTTYPEDYILCAIDKDVLYQTEGTHYNYNQDLEETVKLKDAIKYAYFQTLAGDASDGYKGCPKIGKIKAEKILKDLKTEYEMWQAVVKAYEAQGLEENDALWTMRLANMHQFDGNKINLWNQPTAPVD